MESKTHPGVTVHLVMAAAAEVTGTPVRILYGARQYAPVALHRRAAGAAALQLGLPICAVHAATGTTVARASLEKVATQGPELVAAIAARAVAMADAGGEPPDVSHAPVSVEAVMLATVAVTGCSYRDLMHHGRLEPWETYYRAMQAAARQAGASTAELARALGKTRGTITRRPGRLERITQQHAELVAEIVARTADYEGWPAERVAEALRPRSVAVPPIHPRTGAIMRTAVVRRPAEPAGVHW